MSTFVAAAILASALVHASWNAMIKGRARGDPLASSTALSITWALVGWPLTWVVPPLPEAAWLHLGISIAVHLVYFSLLVSAYRVGDLSFVYTVARGLPPVLVTALTAALIGERPSIVAVAGVLAITAGVLSLGLTGEGAPAKKVLGLSLATAACIATYTMLDGTGTRAAGSPLSYLVWLTAIQGTLFAIGALVVGGRGLAREVRARSGAGLVTGVLSAGGYAVALWAMNQAPIGLVAALRETSVLFAALLGAFALREPFGKRRIVGALLVTLGALLVRLG
jgi:drug/metabolite transporter (DMT)-like permease